ncbi:hypothetical protein HPP92_004061 [Vanilla planifolia]|uniref:Uncharacterized protein n=1 Tax=Vanilla planifolia TaxID=51239 RepID=A0A835S4A8_VANPL|nr:hypothetical protein HPP92_004061 [Vanilla planifolia]
MKGNDGSRGSRLLQEKGDLMDSLRRKGEHHGRRVVRGSGACRGPGGPRPSSSPRGSPLVVERGRNVGSADRRPEE